jgi:hypothetical protein
MGELPTAFRAHHGVLTEGDSVRWRGEPYSIIALDGVTVHMAPRPGSGLPLVALPLGVLGAADDFAVLDADGRPVSYEAMPDWSLMEGINTDAARDAYLWERHIIEVSTGLLPHQPEDATPRPGYAPDEFTLIERYKTKAAELNAVLDFDVSWHTVQRKRLQYEKKGIWGLVDKRRTRMPSLHGRADPRVVDVLLALVKAREDKTAITAAVCAAAPRGAQHVQADGHGAAGHDAVQAAGPARHQGQGSACAHPQTAGRGQPARAAVWADHRFGAG